MWAWFDAEDLPPTVKQAILYMTTGWACYLLLFYMTFYDTETKNMFYMQAIAGGIILFGLIRKKYWGRMFGIVFTLIVCCIILFFLLATFGAQPLERTAVALAAIALMVMGIKSLMLRSTKAFFDANKPQRPDPNQTTKK